MEAVSCSEQFSGKCFEDNIKNVLAYITSNTYPEGMNKAGRLNLRRFASRFSLEDGTLYHSAKGRKVIVVHTMKEARTLFERYHDSFMGGHEGIFKTRNIMTSKYYWPGMTRDIVDWVVRCPTCQKQGKKLHVDNSLRSIKALRVWELLGIDLMGPLPETKNGYIMTVIDCFKISVCVSTLK
uniref:Gypsy retrotransposon integrase-like protein 1 n=1 Tax=Pelodiscus sinensis TaxID=13735 RepID=K7F4E9_PELSI